MPEEAAAVRCPVCQQVLAAGVRFCPHDGTPLTDTSAAATVHTPTGERPRSREIDLPAVVGGRYRLVAVRGGGGMAKVYRALAETLQRDVAVKLINPELRTEHEFDSRFQREARIASQLADPHIVVVHDFGIDAEHGPFLVMEYLQGQSLRERIGADGVLPLKAGLQLSAQLLLALIHAHEKGIVHRDIKPDNIFLLNQSGVRLHVRVLDFGIARIYRRDEPSHAETLTSPGAVLGTPRYMSPEQLAGQPVDARSDLYSAALVIHEALTGQLPYVSGKRLCELCPEAMPALQDLLDRCLRPNPNERPPSAVEVYLQLQELGKASGILLLPAGAMDKLIAARRSEDPTQVVPLDARAATVRMARPRRKLLMAAGIGFGLLAALALLRPFFGGPAAHGETESLLGTKVGDDFAKTVDRLMLTRGPELAWADGGKALPCLGHALQAVDLGLPPMELARAVVRYSPDNKVAVIGHNDEVRAVLVHAPHAAETARHAHLAGRAEEVSRLYDDDDNVPTTTQIDWPAEEGGGHAKVIRYDALGIAFVVHKHKVVSMALYPAQPH